MAQSQNQSSSDIRYSDPEVFPAVTLAHDSGEAPHIISLH